MKSLVVVGLLAAVFAMTAGDVAYAAETKGFDPGALKMEFASMLDLLIAIAGGIFLVVAMYVIVMSVIDSKKYGFSHFVIALVVVIVAGSALAYITGMTGKESTEHYEELNQSTKK